jgi:hypothetical protein
MPRKDNVVLLRRQCNAENGETAAARRTSRKASSEEMVEMLKNFERVRKPDVRRSLIDLVAQLAN